MQKSNTHYSIVSVVDHRADKVLYSKKFDFSIEAEAKYIDLVREHYVKGWDYKTDVFSRPLKETTYFEDGVAIMIEHGIA